MAGIRHRARISDAMAATGAIEEIAESVHSGSPRNDSPASRSTKAFCERCKGPVGDFYNAFQKITGSYYLPTLLGSYSSALVEQGHPKAASLGSELNGCVIQPLCCPTTGCYDTLGFHVLDAPENKHSFRDRDFFKLSRIELRCEESPGHFIKVEPQLDTVPLESPDPPLPIMEVESRPQPSLSRHHPHYDHHHPLQQVEGNRQSLPPPLSLRSPPAPLSLHALPQKSPTTLPSPAVKPVHEYVQPASKDSSTVVNLSRELPPVVERRTNGQYPRSPQEVQLDAIERLQTQVSHNSSALVAHSHDMRRYEKQEDSLRQEFQSQYHHQNVEIRRVDEAVGRLQLEMRDIRDLMETLTHEFHASRGAAAPAPAPPAALNAQDSAVELMAQQIAVISQRANEVDTLKITIEIMKNKIQRLEDIAANAPAPQPHTYASPREQSAHSAQSFHHAVPHINTPVHPAQRTQSYHSHGSQSIAATPEAAQRPEQSQSGWVTVNAGIKRNIESPSDSVGPSLESPKRPKLAPIEPRGTYASSGPPQHVYDHMDPDDSDARVQTHSHSLPPQAHSTATIPESTLPSQHFVPYTTQEAPSDESWRPESQRIVEVRTPQRGRGRGGGPGSRGGRGRKSMTAQLHTLTTPEWEKEDWHGIPDSQISPDGYYSASRASRGIIRRGSGGGGGSTRGRPSSSSGRAVSLGLQGVATGVGIGLPADPYAHTKKTRTKPVRNADGILIRKDGRPDMRSQSSAANLRKVHARKEEQKGPEREFTPTNLQHSTTVGPETPSPTGYASSGQEQDITNSVQKRHNQIMSKIFPEGVEEARKEHDYAHRIFEEDVDHTAHPREHHHHQHQHHESARLHDIKREAVDQRLAETQNHDEDVDMDRPEDHADDEGQTPGEQSDNSGHEIQYRDATPDEKRQAPPKVRQESVPTVPAAPSTVESSETLAASSAQASA